MSIDDNLHTESADNIYDSIAARYSQEELTDYGFVIAAYANAVSEYNYLMGQIADHRRIRNPKITTIYKQRKEALDIVLKLARELKLTPRTAGKKQDLSAIQQILMN